MPAPISSGSPLASPDATRHRRGRRCMKKAAAQRRRGGHQAVEQVGVEDRRRHAVALAPEQHRDAGEQRTAGSRSRAAAGAAGAEPIQTRPGAFERPRAGGAARVERERDHERQEDGARSPGCASKVRPSCGTRPHPASPARRRTPPAPAPTARCRTRHVAHQAVLQREDDRRQAEQQAAVDPGVAAMRRRRRRRRARRAGSTRISDEQQEERDQEGLAAREVLRAGTAARPRRSRR